MRNIPILVCKKKRTSREIYPKMDNKENRDNTPQKEGAEKITSRRHGSDLGGRLCFTLSRLASSGPKSLREVSLPETLIEDSADILTEGGLEKIWIDRRQEVNKYSNQTLTANIFTP
jgi:hypothetical protein